MKFLQDLQAEIKGGSAVVVVGTGVSVQATGGAPCASWSGLLRDGANTCADLNPALKAKWLPAVLEQIESGDTDELISAAERVTDKLGGRESGMYRRWLEQSVGPLSAKDRDVLD